MAFLAQPSSTLSSLGSPLFRRTFEDAPIGMAVASLDGRLLRVNRAHCDLFATTQGQMVDHDARLLVHPDDRQAARAAWQRALRSGERSTFDGRFVRADGVVFRGAVVNSVVRGHDGAPAFVVAQLRGETPAAGTVRGQALNPGRASDDLRRAMAQGELELHFQPVVRPIDGWVSGVESLLRWRHPRLGLLGPGAFIPLAEADGQIVELGRWTIEEAVRHAATWTNLTVGVNVSRRQLADMGLVADVLGALRRAGLPGRALCVEVTETALADDPTGAGATLRALADVGVHVALDDFGTGQSSLSSIRDFPVHILKLDRAFLAGAREQPSRWTLVQAVIDMATRLGLDVVAEGIESAEQARRLSSFGCRFGQGYHYSPPVPADRVPAVVAQLNQLLPLGAAIARGA
jgi:PAS domain S-box-containing protein